jgi:hypothetical protein
LTTKFWEEAVADLASAAPNFSQAAYSGLQKSLQQEWQFVQRVTKSIGPEFEAVEVALSRTFLPKLYLAMTTAMMMILDVTSPVSQ